MPVYLGGQKVSIFGAAGGEAIKTQTKTVTPSESQQTVSPDSGYIGLSSVTVNAISKTHVGSGVTKNLLLLIRLARVTRRLERIST